MSNRTQSRDMREAAPLFDFGNGFKVRPKCFRKNARPGAAPDQGLILDSFAGGGGASTALELALGRCPDIAINHDEDAIVMHEANHPETRHLHSDIFKVDILKETRGRHVDVAWYSPDCFPAGTMVLTRCGYKAIETIAVGESVLTHMGRWRKVIDTMSGIKPTVSVRSLGHPGLECSSTHKFWAKAGRISGADWIPANQLGRGSYTSSIVQVDGTDRPEIPAMPCPGFWWVVGRYVADGWAGDRHGIILSIGDKKAEHVQAMLDTTGWKWLRRKTATETQFTHYSADLARWLKEHFGHLAQNKTVPGWMIGADESTRREFLSGYLSGDGYIHEGITEANTVSKALAFGLKTLVDTLGHTPRVYLQEQRQSFINGREIRANYPVYSVRYLDAVAADHVQADTTGIYRWNPVREVAETGVDKPIYNITVEEDHSYVVEGIVVKNCTHFSSARGGVPVKKHIRGLAWVIVKHAAALGKRKPRVVFMENVREIESWGPLLHFKGTIPERPYPEFFVSLPPADKRKFLQGCKYDVNGGRVMMPDPKQKGKTFRKFVAQLRALGYVVEWRELNAADYGAPTNRRRLFLVARCDGKAIRSPKPTHGSGRKRKYRTAAECINWSLPAPSIFLDKAGAAALRKHHRIRCNRPLKPKTLRRVANGIVRYVINSKKPFLVRTGHWSNKTGGGAGFRGQGTDLPLGAVCGVNDKALVAPHLVCYYGASRNGSSVASPMPTVVSKDRFGLATPCLIEVNHGGEDARTYPADSALHTLTGKHGTGTVVPVMVGCGGPEYSGKPTAGDQPLGTVQCESRRAVAFAGCVGVGGRAGQTPPTAPEKPVGTIMAKADKGIVVAHLTKFFGGPRAGTNAQSPEDHMPTVTAFDHTGIVAAHVTQYFGESPASRGKPMDEPLPTVTADDHNGLVAAHLVQFNGEKSDAEVRGQAIDIPINTIPGDNRFAVSACTITKICQQGSNGIMATPADVPLGTIVSKQEHCATAAHLVKFRGDSAGADAQEPVPTITAGGDCKRDAGAAHAMGISAASLVYLNRGDGATNATGPADWPTRTVTGGGMHHATSIAALAGGVTEAEWRAFHHVWAFLKEQLGPDAPAPIVHAEGATYLIVDIGLRMLNPKELLNAQFSPEIAKHYVLTGTDANKVRKIGNSVAPLPAAALIRANCGPEYRARKKGKVHA